MLRPLRIAVSVVSGLCCVLAIVLWVRSYWRFDVVWNGQVDAIEVSSHRGRLYYYDGPAFISPTLNWQFTSSPSDVKSISNRQQPSAFSSSRSNPVRSVHYSLIVVGMIFGAVAAWLPLRFSLRTLLIATTAVALLLGLIICATRG